MKSMIAHTALIGDRCDFYRVVYTLPGADGLHCYEIYDSQFYGMTHIEAIASLREYMHKQLHLSHELIHMWLCRSKIYFGDRTKVDPW